VHEVGEEEVLHPVMRRNADAGDEIVEHRLAEEKLAKQLLADLDAMDTDDPAFLPAFEELRVAVLTHAVSEQRYEFNRIRHHVGAGERGAMLGLLKAGEAAAPTHPHPGVESAKANAVVGAPTALVDRARDAIRNAREGKPDTDG
jgi:hypothetical protein